MPAVKGSLDTDQENAFQHVVTATVFTMKAWDVTLHFVASSRLGIAVEVTEKGFAIVRGSFGQVVDEGFDLLSTGIAEGGGSAVVSGIGLHETGVEPMLADQEAETVAETRLTVLVAIVSIRRRARSDWIG